MKISIFKIITTLRSILQSIGILIVVIGIFYVFVVIVLYPACYPPMQIGWCP